MKIALLGDVALFGKNTVADLSTRRQSFAEVKRVLDKCDYVVGNLETPLTNATKVVGGKSAYIKGKPEDVAVLKELGVTHVSLANNHSYDFRAEGLTETIRGLDNASIAWFGVNGKSEYIYSGDSCVALHGYTCYSTNPRGIRNKIPYVNLLSPYTIEKQLDEDRANNRFTILSFHWGQEHVHMPNYDHVELARKLLNNRSGLIYGHHPHVIQGIETVNGNLVAYSLGNFCFDDVYTSKSTKPLVKLSVDNMETFILLITIENNRLADYELIPFSFNEDTYYVDKSISSKIEEWSRDLDLEKNEYIEKRNRARNAYLSSRKSMRDLTWYVKRLNFESARMIFNAYNDNKKYNNEISDYLVHQ